MKEIVERIINESKTIATMESCTGGAIVNEITNIEGASEVLKFSAVTYSNDFKIKMGVDEEIINKYTVYSSEVAKEMSKKISDFTDSNYGIGVTGRFNRVDKANLVGGNSDTIYISLYDKDSDKYILEEVKAINDAREENKKIVVKKVAEMVKSVL